MDDDSEGEDEDEDGNDEDGNDEDEESYSMDDLLLELQRREAAVKVG